LHWLSSTLTVLLPLFVTARSSFVSPLKSPTAISVGPCAICGVADVRLLRRHALSGGEVSSRANHSARALRGLAERAGSRRNTRRARENLIRTTIAARSSGCQTLRSTRRFAIIASAVLGALGQVYDALCAMGGAFVSTSASRSNAGAHRSQAAVILFLFLPSPSSRSPPTSTFHLQNRQTARSSSQ
jgi:hypothetical protein